MPKIDIILLCYISIIVSVSADEDPYANEKDVPVRPDEITVYERHGGADLQVLPRVILPDRTFMLSPKHVNYWRSFNKWPCYYPIWDANEKLLCVNPGDSMSEPFPDTNRPSSIPTPNILTLLLIGIGFLIISLKKN